MRGLKPHYPEPAKHLLLVASFTDAWIETFCNANSCNCRSSHLLQMRGLKLPALSTFQNFLVASFTDAWIETYRYDIHVFTMGSHLLQMRGLKLSF